MTSADYDPPPPLPPLESGEAGAVVSSDANDVSKLRLNTSKYDFVQVTVKLQDHSYVLSRFIVSRMLTVAQVHYKDAIKIALELKKRLVDGGMLEVRQEDLEELLFDIMRSYGYTQDDESADDSPLADHGDNGNKGADKRQEECTDKSIKERRRRSRCIKRYKMMTQFHHKRIPLMVIVFGTGCIGKSTLSTMLGERLHLPNVLQTDIVWDLYSTITRGEPCKPVWLRKFTSKEAFIEQYRQECATVRRALEGDITKCFKDGKPIIIEGSHLDPSLMRELIEDVNLAAVHGEGSSSSSSSSQKKGIVVPVFLSMRQEQHQLFIEQWLASRHEKLDFANDDNPEQQQQPLMTFEEKLRILQDNFGAMHGYLLEQMNAMSGSNVIHMVEVDLHRVDCTVDHLHTAVLERIELASKEGAF